MLTALISIASILAVTLTALFFTLRLPKGELTKRFVGITVGHRGCRWISPTPQPIIPPQSSKTKPLTQIPENSLSSFQYAVQVGGCSAVELDCRLTVDGHVVVIHDDIISRVCTVPSIGDKVYISDMTLNEVKSLRYKNWNETEQIPTLEEVLVWAKKSNVKVFVELKSLTFDESKLLAKKATDVFARLTAWEYACIIAFHPVAVYYTRFYQPKIETCILFCRDFFQWGVINKAERLHWWAPFAYIMDVILLGLISPIIVPRLTGCQLVGPDVNVLTKADMNHYQKTLQMGIYCWVANTLPDHDFFLLYGCSVGTDFVFPKRIDPNTILNQMHRDNIIKYDGHAQNYVKNDTITTPIMNDPVVNLQLKRMMLVDPIMS